MGSEKKAFTTPSFLMTSWDKISVTAHKNGPPIGVQILHVISAHPFLGSHITHVVLEPDPHVHIILLTNGNSDTTVGDGVWVQRSFTGELKHREYYGITRHV